MNYWCGEKVELRAIEPDDYDIFYNILKEADIQKFESDIRLPMSIEACKEFAQSQSLRGNDNTCPFLIITDFDGNKVGMATPSFENERCGVFTCGISILPQHQRKGYASDALKLIMKFYFCQLRCCKFNAEVYDYNTSSKILCQKIGLTPEGCRRKTIYTDGKYYDTLLYGMTDEEYFCKFSI